MYSFVLTGKLCLFADNWDVYQGPGGQGVDPHMQIVFLSCLWWPCSCCPCDPPAPTALPPTHTNAGHAWWHCSCVFHVQHCDSLPPPLVSSSHVCLVGILLPKRTKTTTKKIFLSKCIMNIKTFLFTKPQSNQLNLINYSNIYPPTSSSTMPGEFLIKPSICFKLVPLSVHLCKIPGIMKDLSIGYLFGLT